MKSIQEFKEHIISLNACKDAIEWCEGKTASEAWNQCERGDWLLWWCKKENVPLRELTLAKARCAKTVIHLMKDQRSINAVNIAEQFGLGNVSEEELRIAAAAAADYAADYAAYAAADAADAAAAAADYAAAAAAAAADYAAAAAAAADARTQNLKLTADIVRENIIPNFL